MGDGVKKAGVCPLLEVRNPVNFDRPEEMTKPEKETAPLKPEEKSLIMQWAKGVDPNRGFAALQDISRLVHSLKREKGTMADILSRTGEEIFANGIRGGCHDYAIAFASLARASGIPVAYVDSADMEFLNDRSLKGKFGGHAFLNAYVDNRWVLIDPTEGVYYENVDTPDGCLPGRVKKHDDEGEYRTCDRLKMYEVKNLWDAGIGGDPLHQCLKIFHTDFQPETNFSDIRFRPIPL